MGIYSMHSPLQSSSDPFSTAGEIYSTAWTPQAGFYRAGEHKVINPVRQL